jgi:hypothetical protein
LRAPREVSGCEDVAGWELRFSGDSDAEVGRGAAIATSKATSKAAGSAKGADPPLQRYATRGAKSNFTSKGKNAGSMLVASLRRYMKTSRRRTQLS